MAFNFSPKVVTDGLVLYLDAANSKSIISGSTTWNDLSRGGNNVTLVNGPTFNSGSGGNIIFDGSDDYVNLQNVNFTNEISLCIWHYFLTPTVNYPLFYGNGTSITNESFYATILGPVYGTGNVGKVAAFFKTDTISQTSGRIDLTSTSIRTEKYTYMVATYKSSNFAKLYINGIEEDSKVTTSLNLNPNIGSFVLAGGNPVPVSGNPFKGSIFIFQIYNRSITQTEVLQNYNATKTRFGL